MKNLNCFVSKFSLIPSLLVFQNQPKNTSEGLGEEGPKGAKTNESNTPEKGDKIVDKADEALNKVQDANKDSYEQRKQATADRLVAKYKNFVDKNGLPIVEDASKSELRAPVGAKQGDIFVREPGVRGEPHTYTMLENGNFRCINYPGDANSNMTPDQFEAHILNIKQQWH